MQFEKLNEEAILPKRATSQSAGYDLHIIHDEILLPGETKLMGTGITFKGQDGIFLALYARSGLAVKQNIALINGVGVVDSDYYPNEIKVPLHNYGNTTVRFKKGDRVAQAVIQNYLVSDREEKVTNERNGGFGSTGVKAEKAEKLPNTFELIHRAVNMDMKKVPNFTDKMTDEQLLEVYVRERLARDRKDLSSTVRFNNLPVAIYAVLERMGNNSNLKDEVK
jgi:dUTP pyrophosphatase